MTRRGAIVELIEWGRFVRACLGLYLSVSYWRHRRESARLNAIIRHYGEQARELRDRQGA
jgi:hypothetical protein